MVGTIPVSLTEKQFERPVNPLPPHTLYAPWQMVFLLSATSPRSRLSAPFPDTTTSCLLPADQST